MKSIFLAIGLLFSSALFAQQVTIDLSKANPQTAADILREQQRQQQNQTVTPEKAKEWADIGRVTAQVIKETAHSLNVEVNDFAKSDVGKTITFIVIYEYIGKQWIRVGIFLLMLAFCIPLTVWSFATNKIKNDVAHGWLCFVTSAVGACVFIGFLISIANI